MNVHKRRHRPLGLCLALLAATAAVAALLLSREMLHEPGQASPIAMDPGAYRIHPGSNAVYAASESTFAVVSGSGWQLFDEQGLLIAADERPLDNPALDTSRAVSVFYSVGESSLQLAYPDGNIKTLDTQEAIRFADVNEKGQLAVITDREGYKGSVTVYDRQLQPLFRWDAGRDVPVCARLSPKGRVAIACLTEQGSRFLVFRTDREEPLAQRKAGGERILDLAFLDEETTAILTDSALLLHSTEHGAVGSIYPEGEYPSLFDTGRDFAVLISMPERFGGRGTAAALSAGGKDLGTLPCHREILDISACGKHVLLLTGEELILCSSRLEELATLNTEQGTDFIYLRPDGTALTAGSNGVELYDFGC